MRSPVSLLVVVLLAVAGCGGGGPTDANAKKATEWVVSRGGTVSVFGAELPIKKGSSIPDSAFGVRRVDLNERGVTDADLEQLDGLANIEYLGLHSAKITSRGIEKIAGLKSLRELELSYTRLDDAGLKKLEALPKLQKLFINGTRVSKQASDDFAKAKKGCTVFHVDAAKPKAEKSTKR